MMIFPTSMKPHALGNTSKGKPHTFSCDICGTKGEGRCFPAQNSEKEDWAVLPEDWNEGEDRRKNTKKQFLVVCQSGDCQHKAEEYKNGG